MNMKCVVLTWKRRDTGHRAECDVEKSFVGAGSLGNCVPQRFRVDWRENGGSGSIGGES